MSRCKVIKPDIIEQKISKNKNKIKNGFSRLGGRHFIDAEDSKFHIFFYYFGLNSRRQARKSFLDGLTYKVVRCGKMIQSLFSHLL